MDQVRKLYFSDAAVDCHWSFYGSSDAFLVSILRLRRIKLLFLSITIFLNVWVLMYIPYSIDYNLSNLFIQQTPVTVVREHRISIHFYCRIRNITQMYKNICACVRIPYLYKNVHTYACCLQSLYQAAYYLMMPLTVQIAIVHEGMNEDLVQKILKKTNIKQMKSKITLYVYFVCSQMILLGVFGMQKFNINRPTNTFLCVYGIRHAEI